MKIDNIMDKYISEDKKEDVKLLRKQIDNTKKLEDGAMKDASTPEKKKQIKDTAAKHVSALRKRIEKMNARSKESETKE